MFDKLGTMTFDLFGTWGILAMYLLIICAIFGLMVVAEKHMEKADKKRGKHK